MSKGCYDHAIPEYAYKSKVGGRDTLKKRNILLNKMSCQCKKCFICFLIIIFLVEN